MKLFVKLNFEHTTVMYDVFQDVKEHWDDISNEVAELSFKKFDQWVKPINIKASELYSYNGNHFICGWVDNYLQSDYCIYDKLKSIEVIRETEMPEELLKESNEILKDCLNLLDSKYPRLCERISNFLSKVSLYE